MTALQPFTNKTNKPVTVGGKQILPGETRPVDARFVPSPAAVNATLFLLYFNFSNAPKYFGETVVQPDTCARIPANFLVNPNSNADTTQTDLLLVLLDESVNTISRFLSELSPDELAILKDLEQRKGEKRKSLFEAIDKEITLQQQIAQFDPQAYQQHLRTLSADELALEQLAATAHQQAALVEAEQHARSQSKKQNKNQTPEQSAQGD